MPKRILLEEFHFSVFVPRGLPERQYLVIRRVLNSAHFQARLRRHLRGFCRHYRSLRPIQITLTR